MSDVKSTPTAALSRLLGTHYRYENLENWGNFQDHFSCPENIETVWLNYFAKVLTLSFRGGRAYCPNSKQFTQAWATNKLDYKQNCQRGSKITLGIPTYYKLSSMPAFIYITLTCHHLEDSFRCDRFFYRGYFATDGVLALW